MKRGWGLVGALAAAQLVSWGSIYYSFSLFVLPMAQELGWSRNAINGALSLGLLAAGAAAYPVGAWIDRSGGRRVMALGSALAAVLLASWARVESVGAFYVIWFGLGLALAATLYEPVFAVITRLYPESYGTRITALTLIGGFASTVFIPLTQVMIGWWGWRSALVALALCNLAFCLPVHALWLRDEPSHGAARKSGWSFAEPAFRRAFRHPVFWALALCYTCYNTALSATTFHIIPLLADRHVPTATAVAAIAVIGPAQVAGRIALLALGRHIDAAIAGRIAFMLFPAAVALLLAWPASIGALFAFAAAFGTANGIVTIVRGTAVPQLLSRESYGAINGALALPANVARGVAPFAASLLWSATGNYDAVLWAIVALSAAAATGFWYAAWRANRA